VWPVLEGLQSCPKMLVTGCHWWVVPQHCCRAQHTGRQRARAARRPPRAADHRLRAALRVHFCSTPCPRRRGADAWGGDSCCTSHVLPAAQYVGDRLRTATLDYEETGWYDGATFHKPQEVLVRDRLLAAYEARAAPYHPPDPNPTPPLYKSQQVLVRDRLLAAYEGRAPRRPPDPNPALAAARRLRTLPGLAGCGCGAGAGVAPCGAAPVLPLWSADRAQTWSAESGLSSSLLDADAGAGAGGRAARAKRVEVLAGSTDAPLVCMYAPAEPWMLQVAC